MSRRVLAVVAFLGFAGSTAEAQVNPLRYNNPTNQAGMYGNSPVLRYNNPTNQAGMYGNSPVLRNNNPTNQAGMYGNSPVLRYNNPTNQASLYANNPGLQFNNPNFAAGAFPNVAQSQAGLYAGPNFNNPLFQGQTFGWGNNGNLGGYGVVNGYGNGANLATLPQGAFGNTNRAGATSRGGVVGSGANSAAAAATLNGAVGNVKPSPKRGSTRGNTNAARRRGQRR